MEALTAALCQLAESNKQILAKIEAIDEEKKQKEAIRQKAYLEWDIEFIMDFKKWSREKAVKRLQAHNYDVAKVIQSTVGQIFNSEEYLEHVLAHYEYKKNRLIIEGF